MVAGAGGAGRSGRVGGGGSLTIVVSEKAAGELVCAASIRCGTGLVWRRGFASTGVGFGSSGVLSTGNSGRRISTISVLTLVGIGTTPILVSKTRMPACIAAINVTAHRDSLGAYVAYGLAA
ncbi:MAG: hypothetical protein AW09_004515 [Candidatus Accumulibacter phosphatis]|uniref:Uncharacterized protein n=1 Tax=Candidatus Accumulibacter phosphatis TaxID=327160 RepID=A0A084Y6N1_9PROT|nr:MAG: hypothetical protein AW09_004515 [Candidatus Accumulibacter phosphatis]